MDIYKEKFTSLQREILRFLFIKSGQSFNQRQMAKKLEVSPTAISNSLHLLKKENLIIANKDNESKRILIELNKENSLVFYLKRIENIYILQESGLLSFLQDSFPTSTIILFGSYSLGEDILSSDIDIAILGKEKSLELDKFEKILERNISLHFYSNLKDIDKNLKNNILNGITLKGGIDL